MELVNGRPVSELIPRGGLPLDRLLRIAVPLADAVGAAHARGITHRDLKPANVMVTAEGAVSVGSSLRATSRCNFRSRARYTCPIPPDPIKTAIW